MSTFATDSERGWARSAHSLSAVPNGRRREACDDRRVSARRRILYASTNHAWDYGWTFYQMLAEAFVRDNDVVYVDTPASLARVPVRRWREMVRPSIETTNGLRVLRTVGLPVQRTSGQRLVTGKLAAAATARWASRSDFAPDIVWTYAPWELPLMERFSAARSVYWTADHAGFVAGERALLDRVDTVLAASDPVYEELQGVFGDKVKAVAVACDFGRYHSALVGDAAFPDVLATAAKPVFGYAGWLSARLDFELLREISKRTRGTVVVAGVRSGISDGDLRSALGERVVLLGPQSPAELPLLMRSFDVALIPYVEDEFNRHSNPVKFYEYLASGRPTVTTDIPTLRKFADVASVGSRTTFVERALAESTVPTGNSDLRVAVAREHSFEALIRRLGDVL